MENHHKNFVYYFIRWIFLAVIITAICGLIYLVVQQDYRITGNDPQIQISEDVAAALSGGAQPQNLINVPGTTDISKSLATYIMIFDDSGKTLLSTADLHGQAPSFPSGVFDYVRQHNQERVTWQPEPGVRQATVVTYYKNDKASGFVVVGRSLREIENRINNLALMVGLVWLVLMVFSLAVYSLTYFLAKRK